MNNCVTSLKKNFFFFSSLIGIYLYVIDCGYYLAFFSFLQVCILDICGSLCENGWPFHLWHNFFYTLGLFPMLLVKNSVKFYDQDHMLSLRWPQTSTYCKFSMIWYDMIWRGHKFQLNGIFFDSKLKIALDFVWK